MSVRRVLKPTVLPPPSGSEDEFEPSCNRQPMHALFTKLEVASGSESERESSAQDEDENESVAAVVKKKSRKKRRGGGKAANKKKANAATKEMDEIDRSVYEVNAMLGVAKPPPPELVPEDVYISPEADILKVNVRDLKVQIEANKMFGPDSDEENDGVKQLQRNPNISRLMKRCVVPPGKHLQLLKKGEMSMSLNRRADGLIYFTFDHSPEYQKFHGDFLAHFDTTADSHLDDIRKNLHVEGLLEVADAFFAMENFSLGYESIELALSYMQYIAHPRFDLSNPAVRLEYKFPENRPFLILLLRYAHLLSNRACHRSALELLKTVLRLDPSDPLAVLLAVDVVALRAREHAWLVAAVDVWTEERGAEYMFNLQFSKALATFHVLRAKKADLGPARQLLQRAIIRFPTVYAYLLRSFYSQAEPRLLNHKILTDIAETTTSKVLKQLSQFYAASTYTKWREPAVLEWMKQAGMELIDKYDNDPNLQDEVKCASLNRSSMFQRMPFELQRHLHSIKAMEYHLFDKKDAIPKLVRTVAADPYPPIMAHKRYKYPTPLAGSDAYRLIRVMQPRINAAILRYSSERSVEALRALDAIRAECVARLREMIAPYMPPHMRRMHLAPRREDVEGYDDWLHF